MNNKITLSFSKKPSILSSYARILLTRRPGIKHGENLPQIRGHWNNITADKNNLSRYREACGLKNDGMLPVLYHHVLASPVYMTLLSHKKFPLPLIGSLHLRNHIIQHRPVMEDETFSMDVRIGEKRIVKQGIEFDFTILLSNRKERLWESVTTWLQKGKFAGDHNESHNASLIKPMVEGRKHAESYIPEKIGKHFARITGDYNPIHMSKTIAPLFGLKRDVAHAMWVCADALTKLPELSTNSPQRIDLLFKGPLFLDNRSSITMEQKKHGYRFDIYCGDNPRPSIQGKAENVKRGTTLF